MPHSAPPTKHVWKFFRTGGLDQVALESAEDLLALRELDQKLWVVLSCPVKGLELDEKTLELVDTDHDGHIHVHEVIAAVEWAAAHLKRPGDLLKPEPALPLEAINDLVPEGRSVLASARRILSNLGKKDATSISVEDTVDTAKILAAAAPNGDGVVSLRATNDAETQALIKDIISCLGAVADRAGGEGVNAEKVDQFFKEAKSYLDWVEATATKNIPGFGEATGAACLALKAVRPKVEDYFARCRLAEFDHRALVAVNRQETEYLAVVAKDLTITAPEVAGFPLARVEAGRPLPLLRGVNPAWADALATLHQVVVVPLYGAEKTTLSADDWAQITTRFAPYEAWLGTKGVSCVEKLGAARVKEIVDGSARQKLNELLEKDKSLAPEYAAMTAVGQLARYYRDLRTLLHNFVNFVDFYSPDRLAVFQAGTLYLDSRACELCIKVNDVNAHSAMAALAKIYIGYMDCHRAGSERMKVAACFTQGDSDYLMVGRNGLFYDRQGRDWDATITKIVDNPISIRQAFWSPYKKFIRFIEEQVAKRAANAEAGSTAKLQGAATAIATPTPPPTPAPAPAATPPKKFDVGTVAALGVGLGAITTAFGMVFGNLIHLPGWQLPLVVIGVMLAISLPSVAIAALKIRQRTIGPLLEANGWAINGRVKVNIPLGTALTDRALLPANAERSLRDPYEDKEAVRRRRLVVFLIVVIIAWLGTAYWWHKWPFEPKPADKENDSKTTATAAPAPAEKK